jgi:hypothetical protein
MSVVVRYNPPDLTREAYDKVGKILQEKQGDLQPEAMELHVLFGDEGNLKISEIWSSEEAWRDAFDNAIKPAIEEVGGDPGPDPEVFEVHVLLAGTSEGEGQGQGADDDNDESSDDEDSSDEDESESKDDSES